MDGKILVLSNKLITYQTIFSFFILALFMDRIAIWNKSQFIIFACFLSTAWLLGNQSQFSVCQSTLVNQRQYSVSQLEIV